MGPPPTAANTTTTPKAPSTNSSPRSSLKAGNRNGTMILEGLTQKTNSKNDIENNNSNRLISKNSPNATHKKSPQSEHQQKLEQLDQQMREKQMIGLSNLAHSSRGVEALGVLVQYLVFNVSISTILP